MSEPAPGFARTKKSPTPDGGWVPDFLPGFEKKTLELPEDDEGAVVATIIRPDPNANESMAAIDDAPIDSGIDLLYVHGWCDYFFQTHLAEFWASQGVRFHALDLRKYGRSLRDWQTPGYTETLRTYNEDIEAGLAAIGHGRDDVNPRRLILMGHSTGGLTLPLWLDKHPGRADALVLNSPWLEFQTGGVGRRSLEAPIHTQAKVAPKSHLPHVDHGYYSRSISKRHKGEWDIDPKLRPDEGWEFFPGWLSAVFRGQDRIARGLDIDVPIFVQLSARSTSPVRWHPEMMKADAVLNVSSVAQRVPFLGSDVTLVRFDGALHDVTLSAKQVRAQVWEKTARWFNGMVR